MDQNGLRKTKKIVWGKHEHRFSVLNLLLICFLDSSEVLSEKSMCYIKILKISRCGANLNTFRFMAQRGCFLTYTLFHWYMDWQ